MNQSSKKRKQIKHKECCDVCGQRVREIDGKRKMLACHLCPTVVHLACLEEEFEEAPNKWCCENCELDEHQDFCRVCKSDGVLLCCDSCTFSYHIYCLKPPLKKLPNESYTCSRCSCSPLPYKVASILSWRWKDGQVGSSSARKTNLSRDFFVKWQNLNYWKCDWVTETQLEKYHTISYGYYMRNHDMDEPPSFEETLDKADNRYKRIELMRNATKDERGQLGIDFEERYYKYGVRPEWLIVHRVVKHQTLQSGRNMYFVKWRELEYDQCTWEDDEDDVPGLKAAIKFYEDHRAYSVEGIRKDDPDDASEIHKFCPPPYLATTDLKVKYDAQPEYLDKTGMQVHPYQLDGLNWLRYSWANGTDTILADEMGLGKTIQAAAFLYSLYKVRT